jgi:lysophospholipase L1-like esterase
MTNDDGGTFVKLTAGAWWACIVVESGASFVKSRWPALYGRGTHKLRTQGACKIVTYGDSITFCQGTVGKADSTNFIGVATNFGDGSAYNNWRLTTTWSDYLQAYLRDVHNDANITVINRGYSGDSVYQLVKRHITPPNADLGLIMIGINDCAYCTNNHVDDANMLDPANGYNLTNFAIGLQQMLIRETIRGTAIILMTCESQVGNVGFDGTTNSGNILTDAYNDVIRSVGDMYGVPVIEVISDLFQAYPLFPRVVSTGPTVEQPGITHDGVHLDPYGAILLGAKLVAPFAGKFQRLTRLEPIISGSKIVANYAQASVNSEALLDDSAASFAPFFIDQTNPASINLTAGQQALFSFYCGTDDLIAFPAGKVSNGGVVVFNLDFGNEQPEYKLDFPIGQKVSSYGINSRPKAALSIEGNATIQTFSNRGAIRKGIHVATKGWHTFQVLCVSGTAEVYGLQFTGQESLNPKGYFVGEYLLTGALNPSVGQVIYNSDSDYDDIVVEVRAEVGGAKHWCKSRLTKVGASYTQSYEISSANITIIWSGNDVILEHTLATAMLVNFTSIYIYK